MSKFIFGLLLGAAVTCGILGHWDLALGIGALACAAAGPVAADWVRRDELPPVVAWAVEEHGKGLTFVSLDREEARQHGESLAIHHSDWGIFLRRLSFTNPDFKTDDGS